MPTRFSDNFNRPDGSVGNEWLNSPDDTADTTAVISNGTLTVSTAGAQDGVYRPIDMSSQVSVQVTLTAGNGFGGLSDRFTDEILVGSNGAINSGFGIEVFRADQDYADSEMNLYYDGTLLETLPSTYQFDGPLTLNFTWSPNNDISGTVSDQNADTFKFDFGPQSRQLSGDDLVLVPSGGDTRAPAPVNQTFDNLQVVEGVGRGLDTVSIDTIASKASLVAEDNQFLIAYLNPHSAAGGYENLTKSEAFKLIGTGLDIVSVFETAAMASSGYFLSNSYQHGMSAGEAAYAYAISDGQGNYRNSAIYFGIDLPVSTSGAYGQALIAGIETFFSGIEAGFRIAAGGAPKFQIGIYGSGAADSAVVAKGLAAFSWLSNATSWAGSYNDWNIRQQKTITEYGVSVDPDTAGSINFGQWGPGSPSSTPQSSAPTFASYMAAAAPAFDVSPSESSATVGQHAQVALALVHPTANA